jgi:choline dehydrogenase
VAVSYVIVGAGSAGAVLAARLTENPASEVLLLEAGPDYPSREKTPTELLDARGVAATHDWEYTASPVGGRSGPYPRGKVVGGTSSINAALAVRGTPADFRDWVASGCSEWGWDDVLPFFLRLESDLDYRDDLHGVSGPVPVCRWTAGDLVPEQRAFYAACRAAGFRHIGDHNHPGAGDVRGVGPLPMNRRGLERVSTARAYLDPARQRPNLTIRPGCLVDKVRFAGSRAVGVDLAIGRERETVEADRVILSAGAIGSPAILLRSGIGPGGHLAAMGIALVVDLPAVGARLWDHPGVSMLLAPRPGFGDLNAPCLQVVARYLDGESPDRGEVFLFLASGVDVTGLPGVEADVGGPVGMELCPVLMRPRAAGRLALHSADPHQQPAIELDFAADPEDLRRMKDAVRLMHDLARSAEMSVVTRGVAGLSDATAASADALTAYIREHVDTFGHALGTAPMGSPGDQGAVVSQHCQVHGTDNLWVVDASVMPTVPAVPPHMTTIMIAERAATWLAGPESAL